MTKIQYAVVYFLLVDIIKNISIFKRKKFMLYISDDNNNYFYFIINNVSFSNYHKTKNIYKINEIVREKSLEFFYFLDNNIKETINKKYNIVFYYKNEKYKIADLEIIIPKENKEKIQCCCSLTKQKTTENKEAFISNKENIINNIYYLQEKIKNEIFLNLYLIYFVFKS